MYSVEEKKRTVTLYLKLFNAKHNKSNLNAFIMHCNDLMNNYTYSYNTNLFISYSSIDQQIILKKIIIIKIYIVYNIYLYTVYALIYIYLYIHICINMYIMNTIHYT